MNFFNKIIISLIIVISSIYVYGSDENSITSEKIAGSFESVLKSKGWNTSIEINSVNAQIFNPTYQSLNLTIEYNEKDVNSFSVTIDSKKNSAELHKTFLFNKIDYNSIEQVNSILVPYLVSLMDMKVEDEKKSPYYASVKLGYYRTNDNREIFPSTNAGMFFIGWKFSYDPARDERDSSIPLYIGDYLDSSFTLSIDRKAKGFSKLDEFGFDIDLILYGKSKNEISDRGSSRNLYGLFTSIVYFRPYLKTTAVQWSDDLYTDHIHIQYCYWEPVSFIQKLTFINNEKSLSFKYKVGIGPGQNSSITAVSIAPYSDREMNHLNPIFVSRWYFNNDKGDRRHNYYYSITVPIKLEFEADKYLNSKFEFKYHFYYFQAIMDKRVRDFLNHIVLNYGYYITNDILAGIGYEFWHVKGFENEHKKSHSWNRFAIQAEMKI
ncbi:MAG: hypothetical protein FWH53_05500 [Leptospirales bacterium]|nr:hypothetical protein [Leptospirales bacterium]